MKRKILAIQFIISLFFGLLTAQEPIPKLPAVPDGPKSFRAYYTRMNYTPDWEENWRVGDFADVMVTFDQKNIGFVFWRGTSYIPHWVTENGIWYNNQFVERLSNVSGTRGCVEPMSDKQCRYSQVRIIEDNAARKIIHWRYAPVDVDYKHPFIDSVTSWYDWVDEYYFIYPDAVATRSATLFSTGIDEFADWQETIVINQPGTSPEDNLESKAISIANMEGEARHYTGPETGEKRKLEDLPSKSCIQVVHTRSVQKPFIVISPDSALRIRVFGGHAPNSIFHHWDHWPVSQDKSWTRKADGKSNPSHTSLTFWKGWNPISSTENSRTYVMMHGLTDKGVTELTALAKSWLQPADIRSVSDGYVFKGYDQQQRAYSFTSAVSGPGKPLEFKVEAGKDKPLYNPVFIIHNWGDREARIEIDGRSPETGDVRQDIEYDLKGNSLVIWLNTELRKEADFSISPMP